MTPQEWAMVESRRQKSLPKPPPPADDEASLGGVRVTPLDALDRVTLPPLQPVEPPDGPQSRVSKVGRGTLG